tara:strand:- start:782 stop:1042 length:261 start_codon:yes stop_codon:yes gene_type:complete
VQKWVGLDEEMKRLLLIPLVLFTLSCCKKNANDIDAIKQILLTQQKYWNNGNINGFILGFWNSDKFKFSWVNGIEYGWKMGTHQKR